MISIKGQCFVKHPDHSLNKMSTIWPRGTESERTQALKDCVKYHPVQHPVLPRCEADVRSLPKGGKVPEQEKPFPAENPTNFVLITFCGILKSFFLWPPKDLRNIEANSKLNQSNRGNPMSLIQEETSPCGKREDGKAFDNSRHVEEKVYSVLVPGTPVHKPISGSSHILNNGSAVSPDHTWTLPLCLSFALS